MVGVEFAVDAGDLLAVVVGEAEDHLSAVVAAAFDD